MVLHIPNFLVKGVVFSWMGYLTYQYFQQVPLQYQLGYIDWINKPKSQMPTSTLNGEKVEIPEELQQAKLYQENHCIQLNYTDGQKLLERMKTQHVLEEQVKYAIAQKKELRQKLINESNEKEVEALEQELLQLNQLFSKIQSKNVPKD
ncbi:unnamed protein product (macronuclear) [Paramecium tetraurelia]|uniref:Transmembrane protein n=1 Tax=Paramecium tetraurelia TaxID=5888 RepID=A0BF63_PARTE|nr:uncharacterized protein GSPATT00028215001 [Paramecium tetraurelia]CAK57180.1 unnamed protein product [Paramecium tetraurelia]|eukprot:XP_001424578.1 hypothetical protein (macronuclear) [Paramecium tetraurelia strain d4-2]